MQTRQQTKLDTLGRILSFLDDYAIEDENMSRSRTRAELEALGRSLTLQSRAQAAATGDLRLCTVRREALRRELCRRHLRPIAAIAHAELAHTPVAAAFRAPCPHGDHEFLLERAEAIADQAARYRHVFMRHGIARDFVEQLRAVVDAMYRLTDERAACSVRLKAATAALAVGCRRATQVVLVLDALVQAQACGNPALRRAWDGARRAQAVAGSR